MALLRLRARLVERDSIASVATSASDPVILSCIDANTVMMAAALHDRVPGPLGVWLEVSKEYPASLAARDVATLSWLIDLRHVVISASALADAHAEVVRSLLTNEEVNLSNDVANLRHAFNRPEPPHDVMVWSYEGDALRSGAWVLREMSSAACIAGELTRFE